MGNYPNNGVLCSFDKSAAKAIRYAEKYIDEKKDGLILASSADLFLGDFGCISKKDAGRVFPVLERSMENIIENEQDWLLEAIYKVYPNVGKAEQETIKKFQKNGMHQVEKALSKELRGY